MSSIGQTLKGRRERLGMTLHEVESKTQIKQATLKLIENNEFDALFNVAYAEGFIEKYAKAVNIDSAQLIAAHKEEIPQQDNNLDATINAFAQEEKPTYRSKNKEPLQLIVVVSAIAIITALLWISAVIVL